MSSSQNDCCQSSCTSSEALPIDGWLKLAIGLTVFTVLYTLVEGVASFIVGLNAKSITLEGFGLDSLLEISAAILLLGRLTLQNRGASPAVVEAREVQVHRYVGGSFLLLALYVLWASLSTLWQQEHPHPSLLGLILVGLSVIVMPLLAWTKLKVADKIHSSAMKMEAKETLACGTLSAIALGGLILNTAFSWWWADPVAGLLMLPWLFKEGLAGVRGVSCCG